MDPSRFDRITTFFAERRLNRRRAVQRGAAGLAAVGLSATALKGTAAQDATPVAGASPVASGETEKTEFLFVQSFESGAIAPKDGAEGTYTLTLQHGLGQTLYFSDRPERIVGAAPTQQFLDRLGFSPENPPNAALVIGGHDGGTDIAVVELTNPTYDATTSTATYDLTVLQDYMSEVDMQFQEASADLSTVAPSFGPAHLFIDGCQDATVNCYTNDSNMWISEFDYALAMCYQLDQGCCAPCAGEDANAYCNANSAECEGNRCHGELTAALKCY